VEEACVELPWVLEAAAVGSPDPMMGQKVKVFLTMREQKAVSRELEEVVIKHIKARLAPYKAPKEVEFVKALPKTVTGKIRRKVLKEMEEQRYKERTAKDG
jgi:acetyl-CoA synthetase